VGAWKYDQNSPKWTKIFSPILQVVEVNTFGNPILAIEDYKNLQQQPNTEHAMVTVVIPFATAWPNKFMSSYQK